MVIKDGRRGIHDMGPTPHAAQGDLGLFLNGESHSSTTDVRHVKEFVAEPGTMVSAEALATKGRGGRWGIEGGRK